MGLQQTSHAEGEVVVENVGGIQKATVDFLPGVTLLVGRNATNRTSFLQSLMAALGSDNVSIRGGADEAQVKLTLGEETYSRRLVRKGNSIVTDGDPYLEDSTFADLFAFLLESNEARRAVATSGDLRELIMRPIDTEAIQADIDDLVDRRKDIEQDIEEVNSLNGELPGLEEKRTQLQSDIDEKRTELEAKEEELEAADADVEETKAEKSALEAKLEQLSSKRTDLDDVRYDLETKRESLDALKQERRDLEAEWADLPEESVDEIGELEAEVSRLRGQKQRLEADINELQSVIGFNEKMLGERDSNIFTELAHDEGGAVTDQLLEDGEVICWTCGSEVEGDQIEATISRLQELSKKKVSEVNDLTDRIDDLTAERRSLEQSQRERERIEQRLDDIGGQIEQSGTQIDELQARREELTDEIKEIEAAVKELEDGDYSDVLDLHREANQLEYELGKLETELERVESEIDDIERRIGQEEKLKQELETVKSELADLRTKIEQIEQEAIEQFNDHMDTVLEILEYRNLDRIWLERLERKTSEGRRTVMKSTFELHVIRTTESGAAYEDTVEHLSESEREVTGLVFALAGYLTHEVYEEVPFMLLDSLEAIDSERIAALIDYVNDYTDYLFAALLPEDATALSDEYDRITQI